MDIVIGYNGYGSKKRNRKNGNRKQERKEERLIVRTVVLLGELQPFQVTTHYFLIVVKKIPSLLIFCLLFILFHLLWSPVPCDYFLTLFVLNLVFFILLFFHSRALLLTFSSHQPPSFPSFCLTSRFRSLRLPDSITTREVITLE